MNKNFFILPLFILVFIVLAIFTFNCVKQIYNYNALTESAPIKIKNWNIKEIKKNHYALLTEFTYNYKEQEFHATAPLGPIYPNPWAAKSAAKRQLGGEYICWFSKKNVNKAVLIKKFPYNSLLSTLILAGILLYFCGLTWYMQRR